MSFGSVRQASHILLVSVIQAHTKATIATYSIGVIYTGTFVYNVTGLMSYICIKYPWDSK